MKTQCGFSHVVRVDNFVYALYLRLKANWQLSRPGIFSGSIADSIWTVIAFVILVLCWANLHGSRCLRLKEGRSVFGRR